MKLGNDIFIAVSTIMLQPATKVGNLYYLNDYFLRKSTTVKEKPSWNHCTLWLYESMNQAASYWSSVPHVPSYFPGLRHW